MEYIQQLGALALASRLKYLSDTLMSGVSSIYSEAGVTFEPRWFTVTHYLYLTGPARITDISASLGISHPAVVQVVNVLEKKGYLERRSQQGDQRVSLISLSSSGLEMVDSLQGIWNDIRLAAQELMNENAPGFIQDISSLEQGLREYSMYDRIIRIRLGRDLGHMKLIPFTGKHIRDYQEMNRQWLEEYLDVSPYDEKILEDPERQVLQKGGSIFMADICGRLTGTFTLTPVDNGIVELSKFVVRQPYRGIGVGKKMADLALLKVKEMGYSRIVLFTHTQLKEAINLYNQIGFTESIQPGGVTDHSGRCSTFMELNIK